MAKIVHRITFEIQESVDPNLFADEDWVKYVKRTSPGLDDVISRAVPTRYWKVTGTAPTEDVGEQTQAEKDATDQADLDDFKVELVSQIDTAVEGAISGGPAFEWPASSGKWFSLSTNAQIKWSGLYSGRNLVSYPLTISTWDDGAVHDIADAAEVESIYSLIVNTVRTALDGSTAAKQNVLAATTRTDAQAAADAYLNP